MQNLTSEKINLFPLCANLVKIPEKNLRKRDLSQEGEIGKSRKWKPKIVPFKSYHIYNNRKLIQIKVQRSTLFNWISDLEPSYLFDFLRVCMP